MNKYKLEYVYMPNGDINRMKTAKKVVVEYLGDLGRGGALVQPEDVYIVWFCKTLQNWKVLISTDVIDNTYFEVTFNGTQNELYLDEYRKVFNGVYSNVV